MLDIATTFTRADGDCWALILTRITAPAEWRSVRLLRVDDRGIPVRREKITDRRTRLFLGWNGERLAVSEDSQWLVGVATDLAAEVLAWLRVNVTFVTD